MQFDTIEELENKAKEYSQLGFEVFPADEPQALRIGYVAYKEDEVYELFVKLVDCDNRQTINLDNVEEFMTKYNENKNNEFFQRSDSPRELKCGFVTYDKKENIISTYRIKINLMKQLPKDFYEEFEKLHTKSLNKLSRLKFLAFKEEFNNSTMLTN